MPLSELLSALLRRRVRKGLKSIRVITEPIFTLRDISEGVVASPRESTVPSHLVVEGGKEIITPGKGREILQVLIIILFAIRSLLIVQRLYLRCNCSWIIWIRSRIQTYLIVLSVDLRIKYFTFG